ncbi:putative nuclear cap binding complex subunit CBP30 [Trypanosoma conorhini]|uniref:Putative nuclear cap binding complex subunit CBP30 n=1 Tax=Trypanosoma conorhini TaxID=83891 RepID=A0A3S5IUD6_9TRYP|nr:putative nuclear cap binding complex subunit CBP30 [Trypanosoma conorhini]RNF25346.1 putative nuclear cap binding complex subunit CBP30 [Trypanosoma conorhini]
MPRGSGFVHLNTPAAISYSPGEKVSLSELRHARRREDCVVLPHTVGVWRAAFRSYARAEGLTQFVGDIEAEREGEGPILPPLRAPPSAAAVKRQAPQARVPQQRAAAHGEGADGDGSPPASVKGIVIVSRHKLSGEQRFVYPDHDGVLSSGVVPQVFISEEEKTELEADQKHYISPLDLPEEERAALEELQSLWKSRANSRSEQGAKHRAAAGTAMPDSSYVEDAEGEDSGRHAKRARLESRMHATDAAVGSESNTGDMLDDALRLAGEILNLS